MFHHRPTFHRIVPGVSLAQFTLNNVDKRGRKHHLIEFKYGLITYIRENTEHVLVDKYAKYDEVISVSTAE